MDSRSPETVLTRFFDTAVLRGERAANIIRAGVLVLVVAQLFLAYPSTEWFSGSARPWTGLGFAVLGLTGSVLGLRRLRTPPLPKGQLWASVALDALVVFGIGFPGAFWPRELYPGQLHFHTLPYFLLAIVGAGLRMDRDVLRFAVVLNVLGAVGLLAIDQWTGASFVPNEPNDWVLWTVAFLTASFLGDAITQRTRRLASDAAAAVLGAERARLALGVYVSEEIADRAIAGEELVPGGRRQPAAILFCDLRGFTAYAEHLPPERLVAELNDYLAEMVEVVRAEGGVVDKFIGDAIMVVFGVPRLDVSAPARALRAARAMDDALTRHNTARAKMGLPALRHGIGVHYGDVIVGNIGTNERMQYTVVGDTVNLASRLEAATKELDVSMLASQAVLRAAEASGTSLPALSPRGTIHVRGREEPVAVWGW